jgi:hypothetical protein
MKPLIFREMLKRSFFVRLSDRELAVLVNMFGNKKVEKGGDRGKGGEKGEGGGRGGEIICLEFIKKFTQLGNDRKAELRASQLEVS